jgi:hypothetical protein
MDLKNGHIVIAIPESGLFLRDGRFASGNGMQPVIEEMILFSRRADAEAHRAQNEEYWRQRPTGEERYNFAVVPVLVHERL